MRSQRRLTSYEELIAGRYGVLGGRGRKGPADLEELYATYYGGAPAPEPAETATVQWLQTSADAPAQLTRPTPSGRARMMSDAIAPAAPVSPEGRPTPAPANSPPSEEDRAREEARLDLFAATVPGQPAADPTASPDPAPAAPSSPEVRAQSMNRLDNDTTFMADMRSIMSGQKSFNENTRTVEARAAMPPPPEARADPVPPPPSQPVPQPGAGHDIFERIARSMEYAGAYDLGSVNLENRFAQFDRERDGKPAPADAAPATPAIVTPSATIPAVPPPVDTFREDMRDMLARPQPFVVPAPPAPPEPMAAPAAAPNGDGDFFPDPATLRVGALPTAAAAATAAAQWLPDATVAHPFYASGEHILAASNIYPGTFQVGQAPGVPLGYAEIVAMADLYDKVEDLKSAPVAELTQLKRLLAQDTGHYTPGVGTPGPDDDDWDKATGDRYSRLAEDNYRHFAPNVLFQDPRFTARIPAGKDHRSAWEAYHQKAMDEVRALHLTSDAPMTAPGPLVTNAFGDHFLTDAFAAGHVVNKQVIFNIFDANFYKNGKLSADGEKFLNDVAFMAFNSKEADANGRTLADKFKVLEMYEPLDRWWNIVNWHPNINSAERFGLLLIRIANEKRDKVANLAVKAIHDKLNEQGIGVFNGMGQKWTLTGDGHLSEESRLVMQQAIRQSIANIQDPAIRVAGFDPKPLLAKVWAYVPQLLPDSVAWARQYIPQIVHPASPELRYRTQKLLTGEVDMLIRKLLDPANKALRKA